MTVLNELTLRLRARQDLSSVDVESAVVELASPRESDGDKALFLTALADKGETPAEIAAFALAFRARAIDPGVDAWSTKAIDIVGTGGDMAGGFNISSMVVLTLACAGVPVMKHGNRGITSKCGSADLLSALGVDLEASPERANAAMADLGFTFFYAPFYHPTFKHIAAARKMLAAQGRRSVFNILGPLINPGRPAHILLGVFSEAWVVKLATVHDLLGTRAGVVAHGVIGAGGIDELTTATPNRVQGIGRLREVCGEWRGGDYGFPEAPFGDLADGDVATNLAIVEALLAGRAPGGLVDTIVFNAATAMWITGRTSSIVEGAGLARDLLLGGAVRGKITNIKDFYQK